MLLDRLARHGVPPEDVDIVVHTHLHVDHVGWDGSFPKARYIVHEDDWGPVPRGLADEAAEVIVSHFHGTGRFERSGKGFRWAVE